MLKRISLLAAAIVILTGLSACSSSVDTGQGPELTTEIWRAADNTVNTWFAEGQPEDERAFYMENSSLHIGKTADGGDVITLLRIPLRATWLAGEVSEARLFLKITDGQAPGFVSVCPVTQVWEDFADTGTLLTVIDRTAAESLAAEAEQDGWISIPVTEYVKDWLSGDTPNYGLALFGTEDGGEVAVVSGYTGVEADCPYFEVSGAAGERDTSYGRFGYTEMPLPGMAAEDGGNCMAYALRDNDSILLGDLGADINEMNRIYAESGEDAVAEYIAALVEGYVEEHKEGLKITGFRRLDNFDSEIDGASEYRIAMRIGCQTIDGTADFHVDGTFDYHFRAQLDDGRWAQKYPEELSEIIPGSGAGVSPAKYGWDSAPEWNPKFQNFYTSKVIYFAAAKDADGFTQHRSAD